MDRATLATERAAIEMEAASKEIERAAIKFQGDCDRTMPELVAASRESKVPSSARSERAPLGSDG